MITGWRKVIWLRISNLIFISFKNIPFLDCVFIVDESGFYMIIRIVAFFGPINLLSTQSQIFSSEKILLTISRCSNSCPLQPLSLMIFVSWMILINLSLAWGHNSEISGKNWTYFTSDCLLILVYIGINSLLNLNQVGIAIYQKLILTL